MSNASTLPPRALAARVIDAVSRQGQSLSAALGAAQAQLRDRTDAPLLQEICYGTLRWYLHLEAMLQALLSKPLKARDHDLHCLLLAGIYQLEHMHTPPHAVVNETVAAVKALGKGWARGLVNAILRNLQRSDEQQRAAWLDTDSARWSHPAWMIDALRRDWPDQAESMLDANNQRPPMVIRVNRQQTTRADYMQTLAERGIGARAHTIVDSAIELEQPCDVYDLPGFDRGTVSVQDAAAQLAAGLLGCEPGERVLDACAAPGGKTLHVLESCPQLAGLDALDIDDGRLQQIQQNLDRAGLQAKLLTGDAAQPGNWWDGSPYQRILLDVPCSGSGVIRRHPDIKLLRSAEDLEQLAARQAAILEATWPLLAPDGVLLYATCSVFRQENALQIQAFIDRHDDARELPIEADWGVADQHGRQLLPGMSAADGFYYARLSKTTTTNRP